MNHSSSIQDKIVVLIKQNIKCYKLDLQETVSNEKSPRGGEERRKSWMWICARKLKRKKKSGCIIYFLWYFRYWTI